jgi:hypothetical protein
MFPEEFVAEQLLRHTVAGDLVFDPFCGRGTTIFESLLQNRRAAGSDINPVAACIAGAKADAPDLRAIIARIDFLEEVYSAPRSRPPTPFFGACYAPRTLGQILYLRDALDWRRDSVDRFIAAMMLGALHGESHRSELYLSNRMPRTISTKPNYSVRWWKTRDMVAPDRDAFEVLRRLAAFRYRMPPATTTGLVKQGDARNVSENFPDVRGEVKLVVTSPPYLDTTDYAEDQWLRLWFLGGPSQPIARQYKDDRITQPPIYWSFLKHAWAGMEPLLHDRAVIVIRIGGAMLSKDELFEGLTTTLAEGMNRFSVSALTLGITSNIRPRETSAFRPNAIKKRVEHDFTFELVRLAPKRHSRRRCGAGGRPSGRFMSRPSGQR